MPMARLNKLLLRKKQAHQAAVLRMNDFWTDHCTMFEEFKAIGMDTVSPMIDESKRLFVHPNGDYYPIKPKYMATHVLNPLAAAGMSVEEMIDVIKGLANLGFDEFRH